MARPPSAAAFDVAFEFAHTTKLWVPHPSRFCLGGRQNLSSRKHRFLLTFTTVFAYYSPYSLRPMGAVIFFDNFSDVVNQPTSTVNPQIPGDCAGILGDSFEI